MKKRQYKIRSDVWLYPGMAGWHFVNIDKKQSKEIKETHGEGSRGFGSLPVTVTVGKTSWQTSIFPDKKSSTYVLPLKAHVRRKEGIIEGETINFSVTIRK